MSIVSAVYTESGGVICKTSDGLSFSFQGDSPEGKYDVVWKKWIEDGNIPDPYVPPSPPTIDERYGAVFNGRDETRVLFLAIFELVNRVIALEGGEAISKVELRQWFRNKLSQG